MLHIGLALSEPRTGAQNEQFELALVIQKNQQSEVKFLARNAQRMK